MLGKPLVNEGREGMVGGALVDVGGGIEVDSAARSRVDESEGED